MPTVVMKYDATNTLESQRNWSLNQINVQDFFRKHHVLQLMTGTVVSKLR